MGTKRLGIITGNGTRAKQNNQLIHYFELGKTVAIDYITVDANGNAAYKVTLGRLHQVVDAKHLLEITQLTENLKDVYNDLEISDEECIDKLTEILDNTIKPPHSDIALAYHILTQDFLYYETLQRVDNLLHLYYEKEETR